MGFISTESKGAVKFSEVTRHWADGEFVYFEAGGETPFKATEKAWQLAFSRELVAVIPAQPGTYQLEWGEMDDQGTLGWSQMPVIAWGIGLDGYAVSIGGDGIDDYGRAVLHPSGQVTKGLMGSWTSFQEFEAACMEHDYLRK